MQTVTDKFSLVATDKASVKDAGNLLNAVDLTNKIRKKVTAAMLPSYKALLTAAHTKFSQRPVVTKTKKYKNFDKVYQSVTTGAFDFAIKLRAVKDEKVVGVQLSLLDTIISTAPELFFKKKGNTLKKRIRGAGKDIRKIVRKKPFRWDYTLVTRFTKLVDAAKLKIPKKRKSLEGYVADLYRKKKLEFKKGVKGKYKKAVKKLAKLLKKYNKAVTKKTELEAKKAALKPGKKLSFLKRRALKKAIKTINEYPTEKAEQDKIRNEMLPILQAAPAYVRKRLKITL